MIVCETVSSPMQTGSLDAAVTVHAPGRLHLGFLDPSATLGRAFGSLGLVIDGFETVVSMSAAVRDALSADTPDAEAQLERAGRFLRLLRDRTGCTDTLHLRLISVLPSHAGFGSGTQLAMAVGHAFARWHGLPASGATLAKWLGRGARSGIGIAGFDQGGLLVDGGPAADGTPAALLARVALPEAWRIVVAQDLGRRGLSGEPEKNAIATLPPLPRERAAEICHRVLMQILPGAASAEFTPFAAGVSEVQRLLGEHFAPAQGGSAYTSAAVGQLLQWIAEASEGRCDGAMPGAEPRHFAAIGQSSWGPTGFAVLPSQAQAESLVDAARAAGLIGPQLSVRIVRARNHGARVNDTRRR